MPSLKSDYLEQLKHVLKNTYLQLREQGRIATGREDYINGFIDAGLSTELVSNTEIQAMIENTNMEVFGISIAERKKLYADIESSYDEYIDVPAFFRKGKYTL